MSKFKIGDRVQRPVNPIQKIMSPGEQNLPLKYGTVTAAYKTETNHRHYRELYEVKWDNGKTEKGFIPSGLEIAENDPKKLTRETADKGKRIYPTGPLVAGRR